MERAVSSAVKMLTTDNVQQAMLHACFMTGAVVEAFVVAPSFDHGMRCYLRWVVEFKYQPDDIMRFAQMLDEGMRSLNRAYNAMRDGIISAPKVEQVPKTTFRRWRQSGQWDAASCVVSDERSMETLLVLACEEAEFKRK
ncbi:MAG: GH3 auxin-responsive promoter family protein [Rikenellaceae bacterium]|nr:GH3 auxin-responsive promoter family protein [Rikenellaceae bacterium]